jgi:acetyl esterase/lipase
MPSPEMNAVLEAMRAQPMGFPLEVPARRVAIDEFMGGPLVDGTAERAATLAGRPAAWIAASGRTGEPGAGPVVLYLHGGAYEIGSIRAYRHFASELALLLDAAVVVVEYRLAPEHPFPAAVDDALAAYRELLGAGHEASSLALIGDSAGGGLVAAALLAIGRAGLPQPAAGVCLSPWADLTLTADSYERCAATDPFLDRVQLAQSAANYLAGADPRDPLASPALAPLDELGALAPLLIQASAAESIADDADLLGARVREAGGEVRCELWPDLTHVWHTLDPAIPEVRDARATIAEFVRGRWKA